VSDGGTYQNIAVELVSNATGEPAKAPVNTIVTLSSSSSTLGQVQSIVQITAGQTYASATFKTFGLNGSTLIAATASGFTSSNGTLSLVTKAATNLGLYAVPKKVLANDQTYQNIVVQLQTSSGSPEKTPVPVSVSLTTLNSALGSVPTQVIIPAGSTFAVVPLTTTTATGIINITAFATGFQSGDISVNSTVLPIVATLLLSPSQVPFNGRTNAELLLQSGNAPVPNASLFWSSGLGKLVSVSNSTNSSGYASAVYEAGSLQARIPLQVSITKPGYANTTGFAIVNVYNPAPQQKQSGILSISIRAGPIDIPLIIIVPVIAAAVGGTLFFVRRRRKLAEEESEEEEE
jgi:hypothetical protein